MVWIESLIILQPDDAPTRFGQGFVALRIPFGDFNLIVDTTVEFDDELCARDGEVDNHAFDRMLAADGKSMASELAENFPGFRFAGGFVLAQASGASFRI